MEYLPQPIIDPEVYPIIKVTQRLKPYHAHKYGRSLILLKGWVTEYKDRVYIPSVCPGDTPRGECRPCIELYLNLIAQDLGKLLNYTPSSNLPTEYDDLRKLLQLSEEFLEVEGDIGQ